MDQLVGARDRGSEVSPLRAVACDAELGATDLGAELGATDLGAELGATDLGAEIWNQNRHAHSFFFLAAATELPLPPDAESLLEDRRQRRSPKTRPEERSPTRRPAPRRPLPRHRPSSSFVAYGVEGWPV